MKPPAALAAVQEAPCIYLCPVIRVRRLGGCQQRPTWSSVLTQPAYQLQPECSRDSSVKTISRVTLLLFFPLLSFHYWHKPELQSISLIFLWNQMLLCGWSLLALLPSHFWLQLLLITSMTTGPCHKFPFTCETKTLRNHNCFVFPRITCLLEIRGQSRKAEYLVCLFCFPQLKKGFTALFLTLQSQTLPMAVRCSQFQFWDHTERVMLI